MLLYFFKCRKNTESKNLRVAKTKKKQNPMLLSKCAVRHSKNLRFTKEQETSRLLSSLGIRTFLDKIPLLGTLFFKIQNERNEKQVFISRG